MSADRFIGRPQAEAAQYNRRQLRLALNALYDTYILDDVIALERGAAIRAINTMLVKLGYPEDARRD